MSISIDAFNFSRPLPGPPICATDSRRTDNMRDLFFFLGGYEDTSVVEVLRSMKTHVVCVTDSCNVDSMRETRTACATFFAFFSPLSLFGQTLYRNSD